MPGLNYHFSGQKAGEDVLLLVRRHWVTFVKPFFYTIIVFVVPLIAWVFIFFTLPFNFPENAFWIGALVWGLLGVFFVVYNYLDWYLDIYIITTSRIIDITQNGLFHRHVGETYLDNVQDVQYEISGIVATLFNYGNVQIHTSGPSGDIMFEQVHRPQEVQRYLLQQVERYKDENNEKLATPEDLLDLMLSHERKRLLNSGSEGNATQDQNNANNNVDQSSPTPFS